MCQTLGLVKLSRLGNLSSSYGNPVIEECKELIDTLYRETLDLLIKNKKILNKLALELLDKETLYEDELSKLVY